MDHPSEQFNILIVDDNRAHAESIELIINEQKIYKTYVTTNCEDAIEVFCPGKFMIVFVDLELDGKIDNGIDLIKSFRSKDEDVLIVVITAYSNYIFNHCIVNAVDDFVKKPLDVDFFSSKLFLWSTKYKRRKTIIDNLNDKCDFFNKRLSSYETRLSGLDELDSRILKLANKIEGGVRMYGEELQG